MAEQPKIKQRSWHRKIPTAGGPVSYLNIYDGQETVRVPEELRMGEGKYVYVYTEGIYRWTATS